MYHPSKRITRSIAAVVGGVAFGLTATLAVASGDRTVERPANYEPVAVPAALDDWATEHRLSGLSPASLSPRLASESTWTPELGAAMAVIGDIAAEHGMSGLSPASLHVIGD